jgi:hypothetical protein
MYFDLCVKIIKNLITHNGNITVSRAQNCFIETIAEVLVP